ncbi:MAG: hypothetical protein WCF23_05385 [Candidatus Nitrosopolaris sp.]
MWFLIISGPNSGSDAEKFFDVGKRSARLILDKLKAGHKTLKMNALAAGKTHSTFQQKCLTHRPVQSKQSPQLFF